MCFLFYISLYSFVFKTKNNNITCFASSIYLHLGDWCSDLSYNHVRYGEVETTIKSFKVLLWSRYINIGGKFNNIMCRPRKYIEKTKTCRKNQ